ncbi:MAG: hypothetical protein JJ863_17640 [Deltaproteobacteria bacterium]|nr:hypothetical protein [Deltaproteobacteria bacterium]
MTTTNGLAWTLASEAAPLRILGPRSARAGQCIPSLREFVRDCSRQALEHIATERDRCLIYGLDRVGDGSLEVVAFAHTELDNLEPQVLRGVSHAVHPQAVAAIHAVCGPDGSKTLDLEFDDFSFAFLDGDDCTLQAVGTISEEHFPLLHQNWVEAVRRGQCWTFTMTSDEVIPMPLKSDAEIEALRRRLGALEAILYGKPKERATADQALGLYIEASVVLGHGRVSPTAIGNWAHAFLTVDEAILLELAMKLRDPFPWRPLLRLAQLMVEVEDRVELRGAVAHLEQVAKNLLRAQGLDLVRPGDIAAGVNPFETPDAR